VLGEDSPPPLWKGLKLLVCPDLLHCFDVRITVLFTFSINPVQSLINDISCSFLVFSRFLEDKKEI
jgi:hypothetical protein